MPHRSRRALAALLVPGLAGLAAACQETTEPITGVYHPTLISVSPSDFLGEVQCAATNGALQSYVATVFDVEFEPDGSSVTASDPDALGPGGGSGDDAVDIPTRTCAADATPGTLPRSSVGFALASSGPTDCRTPVAFSRIVDGHRYRAEVEGYDRGGLVPLTPGAPILVDATTGERVAPRWKWSCGDECPENAFGALERSIGNCTLVFDTGKAAPVAATTVIVGLDGLAGVPACGTASGALDHFTASFVASGVTTTAQAACGEQIQLDGVPPRGTLTISVLAYEAGNPAATWGTTCTATPVPGLTTTAACAPLLAEGALDVDPAAALAVLGYDCGALDTPGTELRLDVVPADSTQTPDYVYVDASTCGQNVRFSNVPQGAATLDAALFSGQTELGETSCSGEVVPAHAVTAVCGAEH